MIKVSVVIPVYNMEAYLSECLDSILRQTLGKEVELICVNDGSVDSSLYILRQYEAKYDNIRLITQLNSGVSAARNKGIRAAVGEYIAFMDPDDYYPEEDCLEVLYDQAVNNQVRICGGSFSEIRGDQIRTEWPGIYEKYTFAESRRTRYRDYQFDYGYHRFLYYRNMLIENDIWFPPYVRFQDPPFFIKAMITADEFYAVNKVSYRYRYGHQKLKWDERRISHVLMGLTDNLRMSRENNLNDLHRLTAWRLIQEYRPPIQKNLGKAEVLKLLMEAHNQLDLALLRNDDNLKEGVIPMIADAIANARND
ncbi:MAG: glycosyltransferase, partial [Clostridiales bacterium]|nr:glycosyltransferase [Clostridiales bacterium]